MSNFISLVHAFVLTACVNAMLAAVPTQAETFTTLRGALDDVAALYRIASWTGICGSGQGRSTGDVGSGKVLMPS
jgi:hypothetical protein